ncbi:MAG: magnesium transporter [Candidatus Heimdallarchaeota archaeon]
MAQASIRQKTAFNLFVGLFLQAMIALAFESGGIVSGTIAKFLLETEHVKWIFLIYGPLLAARGDIAILAGKLGTGLHMGSVKPSFRDNTETYRSLIASTVTIAILDGILVGVVTYSMNLILYPAGIRVLNPLLFFVIPIIVMGVVSIISAAITSAVSFFTFKKGLNPDVYVVPIMSAINNILITVIFAVVLLILKPWGALTTVGEASVYAVATPSDLLGTYIALIPVALIISGLIYIIIKNFREGEYQKMMKEAVIAVILSVVLGSITGIILSQGEEALLAYPQLLIVFPALIGTLADQVAITSNVFITDFSAGFIKPEIKSAKEPKIWASFLGVGAAGIVITILLGLIGTAISWNSLGTLWHIPLVLIVTVLANVIGFVFVGTLIFLLAIFAFKKELDPDNFAIPLAACLADLVCAGVIILFAYLILPDVGAHETTAETLRVIITATFNG